MNIFKSHGACLGQGGVLLGGLDLVRMGEVRAFSQIQPLALNYEVIL